MERIGPDPLRAKLSTVVDERTFLDFITALADDRREGVSKESAAPSSPWGPGANGWKNATIETFLDAAVAWASDSDGGIAGERKADNPWLRCAETLWAGKGYE